MRGQFSADVFVWNENLMPGNRRPYLGESSTLDIFSICFLIWSDPINGSNSGLDG